MAHIIKVRSIIGNDRYGNTYYQNLNDEFINCRK